MLNELPIYEATACMPLMGLDRDIEMEGHIMMSCYMRRLAICQLGGQNLAGAVTTKDL